MDTEYDGPCRTCGEQLVRVEMRRGDTSAADHHMPAYPTRVCANPDCPTNTGDASAEDVV